MKIPSCLLLILSLCCATSLGACYLSTAFANRPVIATPTAEPAINIATSTPPPASDAIHPSDLLIQLSDLPENWTVSMEPTDLDLGYGERGTWGILYECQFLQSPIQVALHAISEYDTAPQARAAYNSRVDTRMGEDPEWNNMTSLYTSPIADSYTFACRQSVDYVCVVAARYQHYISFIEVDVDPGCIDLLQFRDLLEAIDEDMVKAITQ